MIKQWTRDNQIATAGIVFMVILALSAGVGNHLLAFGGIENEVKELKRKSISYEERLDKQEVLMQGVDTKVQLMLDAFGIVKPKKEKEDE